MVEDSKVPKDRSSESSLWAGFLRGPIFEGNSLFVLLEEALSCYPTLKNAAVQSELISEPRAPYFGDVIRRYL